jgi:oligopeptidase B
MIALTCWVGVVVVTTLGLGVRAGTLESPRARVEPTELKAHGEVRVDPYFWLNRREDPEVLAYLKAENDYLEQAMKGTKALRETLFEEIVSRIPKDDASVPYRLKGYEYYSRYEGDGEYPIYCRRAVRPDAAEEIILNGRQRINLDPKVPPHRFRKVSG